MKSKLQPQIPDIPFPETEDLERLVLADMVASPEMLGDVIPMVHPDFFSKASRRAIWETIVDYYNKGKAVDMASIAAVTGKDYIDEVVPKIPCAGGTLSVMEHARLLRAWAARRRAYLAALNFLSEVVNPKSTESDILSCVESFAAVVEGPSPLQEEMTLSGALDKVKEKVMMAEILRAQGKSLRISTGFRYMDDALNGGFNSGQLIVLAARPSVGKTAIMLQMVKAAALAGNQIGVFSLEMTNSELGERLLFSTGKVKPYQIAFAQMDWQAYSQAEAELKSLPIYFNDYSRTLDDIVSRLTMAVKHGRCKTAFIDYLGLIQDTLIPGNTKLCQVIARITGTLKAVAKRLEIPIVLLCQLNRDQVREKRAPELYDLRDSGSIEQDADVVIMLEPRPAEGRIYAWLRKNRGGKHDIAFVLIPNNTYSAFEEGLPVCELRTLSSPSSDDDLPQ